MSGMLHPVGPEPARTYWIRRGILLGVVLLLALGVVVMVANLTRAAVATAPPPAVLPADTPSPSAATGTSAAPSAASSSSAGSPPTGRPSTASTPSGATPRPSGSATNQPAPSGSTSAEAATPTAKPSPTTTTVGTPDCAPSQLRVTLRGDKTLATGKKNEFRLALVNRGRQTCLTSITDRNFELKIYSGQDRIWSSRDCSKVLADFDKKLAAGADVDWTMTWNGKRSLADEKCENGPDPTRPGTYWATAQLKGADPVQLRMVLS